MFLDSNTLEQLNFEQFPTDVDEQFINNFIELFATTEHVGLLRISDFCRRQSFTSEVLLAMYIQITRRMAKFEGAAVFERTTVVEFLSSNEPTLVNGSWQLQQALYGLLADMESVEVRHPFKFDLEKNVYNALVAEKTSIAVRNNVETLAIVRLENLFGISRRDGRPANDGAARYFLWRLVEALIDAEFMPVMDSIARILTRFSKWLLDGNSVNVPARLMHKARQVRRMGLQFARLIATLCASPLFNITLDELMCGHPDSKALIMSELFEQNKNTGKFEEAELADAVLATARNRLNYIVPVLPYVCFTSKAETLSTLRQFLPMLRLSRYCSPQMAIAFVAFVATVDANEFELFPEVVQCLADRIISTPILITAFTSLISPTFNEILWRTRLRDILSSVLRKYLIIPFQMTSTTELVEEDVERIDTEGDWEKRDSMLEILGYCDARLLDCDFSQLVNCVFQMAVHDCSHFVRATARRYLVRLYEASLSTNSMPTSRPELTAEQASLLAEMRIAEANDDEERSRAQNMHQTRRLALKTELDDIIKSLNHGCVLGNDVDDCVSKECY